MNGGIDHGREKTPVNMELLEATLDVIRQSLQADGGDVALVNVDENGVVTLEMQGACAGCPLSSFDMSEGIERILMEHVPGVTKVQPAMACSHPMWLNELYHSWTPSRLRWGLLPFAGMALPTCWGSWQQAS